MTSTSLAVHIYVNGASVNACEFSRKQCFELNQLILNVLKPASKNQYLDLDMDSNDEYGIITCTDAQDNAAIIPSDVAARANKYISIPTSSEWTQGNLKILLSIL
jgi:hypothetical protein